MCLLIMPDGKRVCYEYSYNTKKYCKKHKLKFKTQHELMCDIIKDMRLIVPFEAKFVVVADSFFDSKEVFKCCMQNKAIYIVPADTNRVHKIHKKSEKLHISGETKKKILLDCPSKKVMKSIPVSIFDMQVMVLERKEKMSI